MDVVASPSKSANNNDHSSFSSSSVTVLTNMEQHPHARAVSSSGGVNRLTDEESTAIRCSGLTSEPVSAATTSVVVDGSSAEKSAPAVRIPSTNRLSSKYLVSEHEEDDGDEDDVHVGIRNPVSRSSSLNFVEVSTENITAPADECVANVPTEIPLEGDDDVVDPPLSGREKRGRGDGEESSHSSPEDADAEDEDESDYEYEYEDEDDTHLAGFVMSDPIHQPLVSSSSASMSTTRQGPSERIRDDGTERAMTNGASAPAAGVKLAENESEDDSPAQQTKKTKWREPSQAAVSMSLRAEREKTGGKRRLASDLYRIMMADTEEAGFSLEPKSEDSMDKWTIKLFKFDEDSNLQKDLVVLGLDHVELEMSFPEHYPFDPPFVRVVRPRFKRQTGFVMNGALCMELLTNEGWNPVNDIESVIVSIRSLLVVGDGRLAAAADMPEHKREAILAAAKEGDVARLKSDVGDDADEDVPDPKRQRREKDSCDRATSGNKSGSAGFSKTAAGQYTAAEARAAYAHLSDYHKKKGWDSSGWWARKG